MCLVNLKQHRLEKGYPPAFLPLIHYILLVWSKRFQKQVVDKIGLLERATDYQFMQIIYSQLIRSFSHKPPLTIEQFFADGFAEKKIDFIVELLSLFRRQ